MNLYDKVIEESIGLLGAANYPAQLKPDYKIKQNETFALHCLEQANEAIWESENEQKLIFQKDMAYELGGGTLPAISGIAFTSKTEFEDGIYLFGKDLPQIKENSPYARLTILNVDDSKWSDDKTAYSAMQRIDYTRYHVYPAGFMMRISTAAGREPVRISKTALKRGLNFQKAGQLFINAYHKHSEVKGVKIIFITDKHFPYEKLQEKVNKMEAITNSLDQIYHHLVMDCRSCNLKPVCDEVEGMRELHQAVAKKAEP